MGGKKEHGRVLIKKMFGPVSMMVVPIYDQDVFIKICFLNITGGNRYIVIEAESLLTAGILSMMSGRPDSAKSIFYISGAYSVYCFQYSGDSFDCDLPGFRYGFYPGDVIL